MPSRRERFEVREGLQVGEGLRVVLAGFGHAGTDESLEILVLRHGEQPPSR
jgi:hypothetical protein